MGRVHYSGSKLLKVCVVLFIIVLSCFFINRYSISRPKFQYTYGDFSSQSTAAYSDTRFAVLSDIHYYDKSLGTTGSAFDKAISSDRKFLVESSELLGMAVDDIIKSGVRFVLISGDLTKDGERINHIKAAETLYRLIQKGIKVYVIPGNHDVNNPGAFKYSSDSSVPVPSISMEQFADIYRSFGYDAAIYRDPNSLSYVAEPEKDIWLIAVDSTRSFENKPGTEEIVSGKLTEEKEKWLEEMLIKAKQNGKAVIYMEHHGVIEHWKGQSKIHPDYLIQDYMHISRLLASYGVKMAFTGHYHAQDIVREAFENKSYLYDIETGSLITPPCPVRYCSISNNQLSIKTETFVERYKSNENFLKYANDFVWKSLKSQTYNILKKYHVSEKDSDYMGDYIAAAFVAHYNGDENESLKPPFDPDKLDLWGRIVYKLEKYVPEGLWKDPYPADNNVTLPLN